MNGHSQMPISWFIVDQQYCSQGFIEGQYMPRNKEVQKYCNALNVEPSTLFTLCCLFLFPLQNVQKIFFVIVSHFACCDYQWKPSFFPCSFILSLYLSPPWYLSSVNYTVLHCYTRIFTFQLSVTSSSASSDNKFMLTWNSNLWRFGGWGINLIRFLVNKHEVWNKMKICSWLAYTSYLSI